MSFKENLLLKIEINRLSDQVLATIRPSDSGIKIDKDAMRKLLEMSPFEFRRERDLDLYLKKTEDGQFILVLDNELPIYKTTVDDVVMRKSPFIKEMVKIRNIIKILKDSDVKTSIKAESLKTVQAQSIALLDLTYDASDIEQLAKDGAASLENNYAEGVIENLTLFADLLAFVPAPKPFKNRHHTIFGALAEQGAGKILFGPMVIYSLIDNTLKLLEQSITSHDQEKLDYFQKVVCGDEKAPESGAEIFNYLKNKVLNLK
jgi:hypothetical protein